MNTPISLDEVGNLLISFFGKIDYLDEILTKLKPIPKSKDDPRSNAEEEEIYFDYFDTLSELFKATPEASAFQQRLSDNLKEFLLENHFRFLLECSKRTESLSAHGKIIKEAVEEFLEKFDDILEIEVFVQKFFLDSSIETLLIKRQLAILRDNSNALENISSLEDVSKLPNWFVRILRQPDLVPNSLRISFTKQAMSLYQCLNKDLSPVGLFAPIKQPA